MAGDKPLLLGIDVGTSAVKVLALSPSGEIHGWAQEPCPPESPRRGWLEIPPERWWEATERAVARLFASEAESRARVQGVGLSGTCARPLLSRRSTSPHTTPERIASHDVAREVQRSRTAGQRGRS